VPIFHPIRNLRKDAPTHGEAKNSWLTETAALPIAPEGATVKVNAIINGV
jgi:hypothetical protein